MLRPGDVVTDMEDDSCLRGKQGLVLGIQFCLWGDPEVAVRFDREDYLYYISEDEYPNGVIEIYPPSSLRRDDDWRPEIHARQLFGNHWHSVSVMKAPLDPKGRCFVEGCDCHQQESIWFNIWGSVCNAYVCAEHASCYHRRYMDLFPWRKTMSA